MKQTSNPSLLKHSYLNGWALFGFINLLLFIQVLLAFSKIDSSNAAHISSMIAVSVRLAVPWLFIAFAASSLAYLFNNDISKWILRNRRIFGLCFASGMAWQLLFILWLTVGFFDYYMAEAYSIYDLSEQIPGYVVLFAMTITSFKAGKRTLSGKQWRTLHKGGIYFLWYVLWSTYWFELYYYTEQTQFIDRVYYWMGIAVWLVRIAAWSKKKTVSHGSDTSDQALRSVIFGRITTLSFVGLGLYLIAIGGPWSQAVLIALPDSTAGLWAELFVPLIAMIPFYAAALSAQRIKV